MTSRVGKVGVPHALIHSCGQFALKEMEEPYVMGVCDIFPWVFVLAFPWATLAPLVHSEFDAILDTMMPQHS